MVPPPQNGTDMMITVGGVTIGSVFTIAALLYRFISKLMKDRDLANQMKLDQRLRTHESALKNSENADRSLNDSIKKLDITLNKHTVSLATHGEKLSSLKETVDRHDKSIHEVLPAMQTVIGELSVFYKGRNKKGE